MGAFITTAQDRGEHASMLANLVVGIAGMMLSCSVMQQTLHESIMSIMLTTRFASMLAHS